MKWAYIFLVLNLSSLLLVAQDSNGSYNPFVSLGMISPSPLLPSEEAGHGLASFSIGNSGSDGLEVYSDQYIVLIITLSNGVPDNIDPISAISGTSAGLFTWAYNNGTYTAVQTSAIPPYSSGNIQIAYKVTQNTSSPGSNGFNVNITPAPYQANSNLHNDDAVNSYTYTAKSNVVVNSNNEKILIYPNPSNGNLKIDLGKEWGSYILEIAAVNERIVNRINLKLNGFPISLYLGDLEDGMYYIRLFNEEIIYHRKIIILN